MVLHAAIVEDDLDQAKLVASWLKAYGYQASLFVSAELFLEAQQNGKEFDLLLIDWLLPGMSGIQLVKVLTTQQERAPIIFMTRLQKDDDLAQALHSGADDFISKPLSKTVLLARVHAVTRRKNLLNTAELTNEAFKLDASNFTLKQEGYQLKLTASEFRLMQLFSHSQGYLFSREELADSIWGDSEKAHESRALDLLISRLRKKLQTLPTTPGQLVNHYGQGYTFEPSNKNTELS